MGWDATASISGTSRPRSPRRRPSATTRTRYLQEILTACERVAERVRVCAEDEGRMPLVLGGDHSVALGTLGGLATRQVRAASSGSTPTAT